MSEYQASVIWNRAESEAFTDNPIGIMAIDTEGKLSMTKVTLRPKVVFYDEKQPSFEQLEKMHHQSHQQCFSANSVKTEIVTEITYWIGLLANIHIDLDLKINDLAIDVIGRFD